MEDAVVGSRTHEFVDSLCEKVLRNKGVLTDPAVQLRFAADFVGGDPLADRVRLLAYMLADPAMSLSYILNTWVTPEEFARIMSFVVGAASRHSDLCVMAPPKDNPPAPKPEAVEPPAAKATRKRSTKPTPTPVVEEPVNPPDPPAPAADPIPPVVESTPPATPAEEDDISAMFRAYAEEPPKEIPADEGGVPTSEEGVGDMTPDNIEDLFG
mgnify:CR=1 FL=1